LLTALSFYAAKVRIYFKLTMNLTTKGTDNKKLLII